MHGSGSRLDESGRAAPAAPLVCVDCGAPFLPALRGQASCDACQGLVPPEDASPLRESSVAGYRLVHQLGAGRFATSWLAQGPGGANVVVKLLRSFAPDAATVQRFLAETDRLARAPEFEHPSIARLVGGGVHVASSLFLVYEAGGETTLAEELRARGRFGPARALELCAQLAGALACVHRSGILHLDLKPANVALAREREGGERAVLLDAATSHLLSRSGLREAGRIPLSTAAYLSPEEAGGEGDVATGADLYALGVLLFQLLSGELPFQGATAEELVKAQRECPPLLLSEAGCTAHPELEALVGRLLAKHPLERLGSGEELAVVLRAMIPVAETYATSAGALPANAASASAITTATTSSTATPTSTSALAPEAPARPTLFDPALARALLGEGFDEPAERSTIVERLRGLPWRWKVVTCAVAALALAGSAVLLTKKRAAAPRPGPARAELRVPARGMRLARPPAEPGPAATPSSTSQSAQPVARQSAWNTLERARRMIRAGRIEVAERKLEGFLSRSRLSRRSRAYALRLMGYAEAKRGDPASAADWYERSLQFTDDPAQRARTIRRAQRLKSAVGSR